jgi:hypothetical protein
MPKKTKLKQKQHICATLGYQRESPVKCVCGASTVCRTLSDKELWRWWDKDKPYLQWYCKVTGVNINYCSVESCHTTLIGKYENYKRNIEENLEEMWVLLQHFSGIDGR